MLSENSKEGQVSFVKSSLDTLEFLIHLIILL
jgi:hypothetical protein